MFFFVCIMLIVDNIYTGYEICVVRRLCALLCSLVRFCSLLYVRDFIIK